MRAKSYSKFDSAGCLHACILLVFGLFFFRKKEIEKTRKMHREELEH